MCASILPFAFRMHASNARDSLAARMSLVSCPLRKRTRSSPETRSLIRAERSKNTPAAGTLRDVIAPARRSIFRYSPSGAASARTGLRAPLSLFAPPAAELVRSRLPSPHWYFPAQPAAPPQRQKSPRLLKQAQSRSRWSHSLELRFRASGEQNCSVPAPPPVLVGTGFPKMERAAPDRRTIVEQRLRRPPVR